MTHWNSKGIIRSAFIAKVQVTSDVLSSWGCGAWSNSDWFQLSWSNLSRNFQIAIKELILVIVTVVWGQKWKGCAVTVNCDNEAFVAILNCRIST